MSVKTPKEVLTGMKWIRQPSYQDQIESPEWEQFSRQMRADVRCCEVCRQPKGGLQIHHIFYDPTRKLWEYSRDEVMILCDECHKQFHLQLKTFRKFVFGNLTPQSFRAINLALGIGARGNDPLELAYAMCELASDPRAVKNFCRAWTERKSKAKELEPA